MESSLVFGRTALALVGILTVATVGLAAPGTAAACTPTAVERALLDEVNRQRTARGVRALRTSPHLTRVARHHSHQMRRRQQLRHQPIRTMRQRVRRSSHLGENVGSLQEARDRPERAQARQLTRIFLRSRSHRANLLDRRRYRFHGVGAYHDSSGTLWVTHLFAGPQAPRARLRTGVC